MIEGCRPLIAPHFNITVELPLKAIVRGFSWTVIPITWRNRRSGEAKLKIKEMGSRGGYRHPQLTSGVGAPLIEGETAVNVVMK